MAEAVNNDALNPAEENSEANAPKKVKKIKPEKVKAKKEKSTKKSEPSDNSKKKKRKRMSYESKQSFVGFMFTLPWLIGFLMFFFIPAIKSINFSLSDVKIFEDYATEWNNFQNYSNIFKDATFLRNLSSTFGDLEIGRAHV